MAKLTQREISKLRADYLLKRESILKGKVNSLQAKLFEKVFDRYLLALEQSNGKLVTGIRNENLTAGLDKIYKEFLRTDNSKVANTFLKDLNGIHDLNIEYFSTINQEEARAKAPVIKKVVDRKLGLTETGEVKKGGFTDKFLRDEAVLKQIKKLTNKAIKNGQPFTEFKKDLKTFIEGNPKVKDSGGLQQYYRNYAYDTFQQVDRINQDEFAQKLELRYFIYSGGLIRTSRPFCIHYNGRIIDSHEFRNLKISDIPETRRGGLPDKGWVPMLDLGGFGCRHSVNWVATPYADDNKSKFNKKASERAQKFRANK